MTEKRDPGFTRREMPAAVGMANGCAIVAIGGAVMFLLIVLGFKLFS